jgi:peptidyl-prolyl cis-trans isomerase A (cyclophilin A)
MTYRSLLKMTGASVAIAIMTAGVAAQTTTTTPKAYLSKAKLRTPAQLTEKAPATFKAKFDTSKGPFVIDVHREWSPNGADRFYNLVKNGFYDDVRFFRVIADFMVQFGISGDPALNKVWAPARIPDDPVKQSNKRGFASFAMGGPNTRTTQVFINYTDNGKAGPRLDSQGFSPFGEVVSGMDVVDKLYSGYGEAAQRQFMSIQSEGNAFLAKNFPKLDYVKKATIEK